MNTTMAYLGGIVIGAVGVIGVNFISPYHIFNVLPDRNSPEVREMCEDFNNAPNPLVGDAIKEWVTPGVVAKYDEELQRLELSYRLVVMQATEPYINEVKEGRVYESTITNLAYLFGEASKYKHK